MPETPRTYFSTIEIEDVRCFGGRQVLDLTENGVPARWSLIIGENGAGKTTLLECLAWMSPDPEVSHKVGIVAGVDDSEEPVPLTRGLLKPVLLDEENAVLETLPRIGSQEARLFATLVFGDVSLGPVDVSDNFRNQGKNFRIGLTLNFDGQSRLMGWTQKAARIANLGDPFQDPLIVSYGASRYLGEGNSLGGVDPDERDHQRLSRGTELFDIEEILMSLDYAVKSLDDDGTTKGNEREVSSLELLKQAITKILPDDLTKDSIVIYAPNVLETGRRGGVHVQTFTGQVPMSALSLGYRATMGWVADLAWRMLHRYPRSQDPLAEPAIVLIDEIDLHLHPRWQLKIMEDLSLLFPATQFIATSHSPLIVQAAETANLVLLRKREDDVEIVNKPGVSREYRVDQILTSLLFGVPSSRPESIERLFGQRAKLVDKPHRSQEEEDLLRNINRKIHGLPTAEDGSDWDAMKLIREFADHLEQGGASGS